MNTARLYIDSRDMAKIANWPARRVQRLWRKVGIAMRRGKSVVTTYDKLAEAFPEQAEAIMERLLK